MQCVAPESERETMTVTVVVIRSLSFTGTTWFNTVLGCHADAFALGPASRVLKLLEVPEGWAEACVVHGAECQFWSQFHQNYDPHGNFFHQIAKQSGKHTIIINNPEVQHSERHLGDPTLRVKYIDWNRDGRAIAASYWRKWPENDFYDVVTQWLQRPLTNFSIDTGDPERLRLRYEDVMASKWEALQRAGSFIGLRYDRNALRFWEYDLHITGGNQWMYQLIKLGQGLPVQKWEGWEFYEAQFEQMKASPEGNFEDERWEEELGARERFIFDYYCGTTNERNGYPRDRFTSTEFTQFSKELAAAREPAELGEHGPASATHAPMAAIPRLREQLRPAYLFSHGLHMTGAQARLASKLAFAIVLGIGALLAFAALAL